MLAFGNGAVQDSVNKSADGGHGRSQLVGNVGDKALSVFLDSFKGACHIVKGIGKVPHFVLVGYVHLFGEITLAETLCRQRHFLYGAEYPAYGVFEQRIHNYHYHCKYQQERKYRPF